MLGNPLQQTKKLIVISPGALKDNAAWTTNEIDTLGYDYCVIDFFIGATDIAVATLKVTESDTSGSGFADVTGLIVGTSTNIDGSTSALLSATDDNKIQTFEIDLRGRKRYLDLSATAGDGTAGTYAAAIATLYRAKDVPVSATERGIDEILRLPA
jgi:hypothetical protein